MRKTILLLPLAIALAAIFAFTLVQQDQGEAAPGGEPSGGPPASINYACYLAPAPPIGAPVIIANQYESSTITVLDGTHLCPPTGKDGGGPPPLPTLRCHAASSPVLGGDIGVDIVDQYGIAPHIIGPLVFFCVPATKDFSVPPPAPYYACYDSPAAVAVGPGPIISNQFETGPISLIDDRAFVCVPSLKFGAGDPGVPPLTCYFATSSFAGVPGVPVTTQFEPAFPLDVGPLDIFCTEAVKLVPPTPTATPTATATVTPTPTAAPASVNYACYVAPGPTLGVPVAIENQYESSTITVLDPTYLCPPTDKDGGGLAPLPTLRCYTATGPFPGGVGVDIADQYGVAPHIIGPLLFFCAPATKDFSPPPPGPYMSCYDSFAAVAVGPGPIILNQFETGPIAVIDDRVFVCVPSLKFGAGDLGLPPLACYLAASPFAGVIGVPVTTQFEPATPLDVGPLDIFCTEAVKLAPTPTPTATPTATPTPTPTKQPFKGDTDGDGCADVNENLPKAQSNNGGGRDYMDPWDYYDVNGDGFIDLLNDILGVINHYQPAPGGAPPYAIAFDRGPTTGPNSWNMTAPDGVIDLLNDILGVIQQYQPLGCV